MSSSAKGVSKQPAPVNRKKYSAADLLAMQGKKPVHIDAAWDKMLDDGSESAPFVSKEAARALIEPRASDIQTIQRLAPPDALASISQAGSLKEAMRALIPPHVHDILNQVESAQQTIQRLAPPDTLASISQAGSLKEAMRALIPPSASAMFGETSVADAFSALISSENDRLRKTLLGINGEQSAIEQLQKLFDSPVNKGLTALSSFLELGLSDPEIQQSNVAVELLELFLKLLSVSHLNANAEDIIKPLIEQAEKTAISNMQAQNAGKKNQALREWAQGEWPIYKAKGYSRARFSKWCVQNQPNEISGQMPSAEQIARVWLKEK